jgi:pyruvate/2-oxoglutarate/acetoin dehydrogenase E1 component
VAGTIPPLKDSPNIVELSMADVAGGGIAVGAALDGIRPIIYVVRYQGFLWYNAISIVNYAAKSFELFGVSCPLLVRAIGMEGSIGPVAGNSHLSLVLRMPGVNVFSPMTGSEWQAALDFHLQQMQLPTIIGEHRLSYGLTSKQLKDSTRENSQLTILAIGAARINAQRVQQLLGESGIEVDFFNLFQLSPLDFPDGFFQSIHKTGRCLVVDSDYEEWGPSENVAYKIFRETGLNAQALGLPRKSAGFSKATDNLSPPINQIVTRVMGIIKG